MHPRRPRPIRSRLSVVVAALLGCATIVAGTTVTAVPALARDAPSAPEAVAPQTTTRADVAAARDPEVLFREGFEDGAGARPVLLDQYVGPGGTRYTADPYWLDVRQCNGIVTGAGVADQPGCQAGVEVRRLAEGVGAVTREGREHNHAVSAYTWDSPPSGRREQLRTVRPVPLPGAARYLSFGVATAATACDLAPPLLAFSLLDGETAHATSPRPIDACDPATTQIVTVDGVDVRVGTHVSPGGLLVDADEAGVLLENEQASGSGNDAAFDDVTMLDSTPTLAWSFSDGEHVVGDPVRATVSVVNTSEAGQKPGWSFRTALPDGTRPADGAVPTAGCAVDRVALDGGDLVVEGGDLAVGDAACDVELDLVSDVAGAHGVGADELVSARGVLAPTPATLVLAPEAPALTAAATPHVSGDDDVADLGERVTVDLVVTNASNVPVHDLAVEGAACPVATLAVGASTTCVTPPRDVVQGDLDAGSVDVDLTATGRTRLGAPVTSDVAHASVPTSRATVAVSLALRHDAGPAPATGQVVTVTGTVTNVGNRTLQDVRVEPTDGGSAAFSCPVVELAPGASAECTTTLALDQAIVDAGGTTVSATASGRTVTGGAATSTARTTVVVPERPHLDASAVLGVGGDADRPVAGDPVALRVDVVADGSVTVHDVAARLAGDGGTALGCPVDVLAPGARTQCSLDGTLQQAEVDAGVVVRDVVVDGRSPRGTALEVPLHVEAPLRAAPALAATTVVGDPGDRPEAGDRLSVAVRVEDVGTTTLRGVAVAADRPGLALSCPDGDLAPGAAVTCTGEIVLTQADLDAGLVDLPATATGTAPDGRQVGRPTSGRADLPTSSTLDLSVLARPAEGVDPARPVAGDAVAAVATVTNTGTTTLGSLALDGAPAAAWACDVATLAPGRSTTCRTSVVLDQQDVDAGSVTVPALAHAASARGAAATARASADVDLPSVPELSATTELAPQQGDRAPVVGSATVGTTTVVNTGSTTVTSLTVTADGGTDPVTCSPVRLAPGASATCATPGPTVTQDDLERGVVGTTATASGVDPHGARVEATASASLDLPAHPGLGLVVTVAVEHDGAPVDPTVPAEAGDALTPTWTVRNGGDLVVDDLEVDAGLGPVTCASTLLLPGQATDCALGGPHVVTDAEATAGAITFASQAFGQVARAGTPEATAERVLVPRAAQVDRPVRVHSLLLETTVRTKRHVVSVLPGPPQAPRVLAFTGASLGLVLALGLGLTGAGTALRARRRDDRPHGAAPGGEASE